MDLFRELSMRTSLFLYFLYEDEVDVNPQREETKGTESTGMKTATPK